MEPERIRTGRRNGVGTLADDGKAEIFQNGNPLRKRNRLAKGEDLETGARFQFPRTARKIESEGRRSTQPVELAHVAKRLDWREGLAIGRVEGRAITRKLRHRLGAGCRECCTHAIRPGADDRKNAGFQRGPVDGGGWRGRTANDVMCARKRPFRIGRISSGNTALISFGQEFANPQTDCRVIAVLGNIDHNGYETIKAIDAGKDAQARALEQGEHIHREAVKRLDIDLEQLVARITLEHVEQGLAGMAGGIKPGALDDARHLVAQVGHAARGIVVSG